MGVRNELTADKLIELHVRQNLSLTEIGKQYGISRQRVHQLKQEYEKKHGKINRRFFVDVFTLKHYLEKGWTTREIAQHFDMKPSQISRLIRKYQVDYEAGLLSIELKRHKVEDLISKRELLHLYTDELHTDAEIATMYQVSPSAINFLRKKYNIPTNKDKKFRKLPNDLPKETFVRLYRKEGYTLQEIADRYNCNVVALINLKKKYGIKK